MSEDDDGFREWKLEMFKFFETHKAKMGLRITIVCECPNCHSEVTLSTRDNITELPAIPLTYENATRTKPREG